MVKLTEHKTTPLQAIHHPFFSQAKIQVWVKRDDLNHPIIQGNKLHKLRFNLQKAQSIGCDTLISFGGAYSNHIAALSVAGKELGFKTIGFIRGDELMNRPEKWSHTLKNANHSGMKFIFLTRKDYREKHQQTLLDKFQRQFPTAFIIPEGGTNSLAVAGFKQTIEDINKQCPQWTHLYTAVGTGGTLAGLAQHSAEQKKIIGIATLKQAGYLEDEIQQLTTQKNWQLLTQYAGSGYAKLDQGLIKTQRWFEENFAIKLDPIYTNKMVFGFLDELKKSNISENSKVILYHSGGLQGIKTLND